MISVKALIHTVERFTSDNAPVILTAVGVVGSISSVILTGKATFKAAHIIEDAESELWKMTPEVKDGVTPKYPEITGMDAVKLVWKEYLPAAGTLAVTVSAVVFANHINTKRAAAMAAAYSLSERAYGEYREKIASKFNENKERQVRDEIAQDHVTNNPPTNAQIIVVGSGNLTCYDQPSDRYFKSTVEKIKTIQNQVNASINEVGEASLEELYAALDLQPTPASEELGWTRDHMLDIKFSSVLTPTNEPVIVINYDMRALRNNFRYEACAADPPF